jgi:hypothetical protein
MVLLYGKHGSSRKVREHWDDAHDENTPPSCRTISNTVTRFIETGSIDDFPRSGRLPLKTDQPHRVDILSHLPTHPALSIRKRADVLHMSPTTTQRLIHLLEFKP